MKSKRSFTKDDKDQDAFDYLGVKVRRDDANEMYLMQPELADKILAEVKDCNLVPIAESKQRSYEYTPAATVLGSHKEDPPFDPVKFGFFLSQSGWYDDVPD